MTWGKLDDKIRGHPKLLQVGFQERWQYIASISYACEQLTDGFIPAAMLRMLSDVDDPAFCAERLVAVGLWEPSDGGFLIHDFLDYNPSKEAVLKTRKETAERVAKWRERNAGSNGVTNLVSNGDTNDGSSGSPVPVPVPVPVPAVAPEGATEQTSACAPAREQYSAAFDNFWSEWMTGVTKGRGSKKGAYDIWKKLGLDRRDADRRGVLDGLRRWKATAGWQEEGGRFIPHAQKWLKQRGWEDEPPDDVPGRAHLAPIGHHSGARGENPNRWFAAGEQIAAKEQTRA